MVTFSFLNAFRQLADCLGLIAGREIGCVKLK
jgi:hypothetical protein